MKPPPTIARLAGVTIALACSVACSAAVSGCSAADERHDVVYDERFGGDTSLDLYLPDGGGDRRPAVLLVHGGALVVGIKEDMQGTARRLARQGYVAASINYRLIPGGGAFPKPFQDAMCSLAFLRAHAAEYRLDPARIAVMGYSAGGYLASLVGVAAKNAEMAPDCAAAAGAPVAPPAAVVSGSGPQDQRKWTGDGYIDGTPDQNPHAYDLASPIFHVAPGDPPFLLVEDDLADGVEANVEMERRLHAAGDDATLLKVRGGWHVLDEDTDPGVVEIGITTDTPEGWMAIEDFLARTIGEP